MKTKTKELDLNELSFSELKEKLSELEDKKKVVVSKEKYFEVGENYLVRTVTHIDVGRLVDVTEKSLVFEDCSWVADTGRFATMLEKGLENVSESEIEPFGKGVVIVERGAVIDMVKYNHKLPSKQK